MDTLPPLDGIAAEFDPQQDVAKGKWFGKSCLKVGDKVFAVLFGDGMAFKLAGEAHAKALQVDGAHLFDPRGRGAVMREWVHIPVAQQSTWLPFAMLACATVAGAAQAEKDSIISGLVHARQQILDAAKQLSPEQQSEVFLGVWSAKDLLAHLAGWDDTNLQAVHEILAGLTPGFHHDHDRDWQTYNARLVHEYRRDDWCELLALVEESHRCLIDTLQTVPAASYLKNKKIGSLLRVEIKDEQRHHRQVLDFLLRTAAREVDTP